MRTSIIAAMGRNHVIGTDAGLPWHLPRDLKRFRSTTSGKPVIMGRKTMDHIGHPLPNRTNIVLSRQPGYAPPGVLVARTVEEALAVGRTEAKKLGADEVMVIGGGEVYRAFLPFADRVYLTVVDGEFEGTATFPFADLRPMPFEVAYRDPQPADERNPHAHTFWLLDRVSDAPPVGPELLRHLGVA